MLLEPPQTEPEMTLEEQQALAGRYASHIKNDLEELKETLTFLEPSKANAHRNTKYAKSALIGLGLVVGVLGITLSNAQALHIGDALKTGLTVGSTILGFLISFITQNFDPANFRERAISLNVLILKIKKVYRDFGDEMAELTGANGQPAARYLPKLRDLDSRLEVKKQEIMEEVVGFKPGGNTNSP